MNDQIKKFLNKYDAILVSSASNIKYLTGYTGFSQTERECFLLITKNKQYLITDQRYSNALSKNKEFEIIDIGAIRFLMQDYSGIIKNLKRKKVGIEENDLTVSEYKIIRQSLKKTSKINLNILRTIKSPEEIRNIKTACKISDQAFNFILNKFKIGVTEKQIAELLISFFKNENADLSFYPIVAFGKNSAIPHHQTGETKLKPNSIVLLDFGVVFNSYCSDMSRTIYFGKANDKFKKIHKTVLEAQSKSIAVIKDSIKGADVDKAARDYITQQNFPNIIHSVGHGIGLEVHEPPFLSPSSSDLLTKGMVFSVEPGIYLENYGGVRIEDLVTITSKGAELISHANRNIIEI